MECLYTYINNILKCLLCDFDTKPPAAGPVLVRVQAETHGGGGGEEELQVGEEGLHQPRVQRPDAPGEARQAEHDLPRMLKV